MTATTDPTTPVATTSASERDDLRAAVRDLLADRSPLERVAEIADGGLGHDADLWSALARDLGVASLLVPTEYGGDGYGHVELQVVAEEAGRALLPGPLLGTVGLGVAALTASGDASAQAAYLPRIAAGELTATVAVGEGDGAWRTEDLGTWATPDGSGEHAGTLWRVDGVKPLVVDGASADLVLVVASTSQGPTLFALEGGSAGTVVRTPLRVLDPTRPMAHLDLRSAPAVAVGAPGDAARIVEEVVDLGTTVLAAEQLGAARACLDSAAAYARDRVQFGRPIGSFQAVKHKCADMLVRVALAEAAATEAAESASRVPDADPLAVAAAVAHVTCSEAFVEVAREAIQVFGGVGFTWEHHAHRYFRRAKSSQLLFGGPAEYHERLLRAVGV